MTLLKNRIVTVLQATAVAIEKVAVPKKQRPKNISDFRMLNPKVITGNEKLLEAENWLVGTTNLLAVLRIPKADQVEVVKIQLTDIARTWWLAEEARMTQPISWKQFSDNFYMCFFPKAA